MPDQPGLRIGDRERDTVATELREHYAHGRLSLEEFNQRLDAVFAARTQADLSRITSDLPLVRPWGPLPSSRPGSSARASAMPPGAGGPGRGAMAASWAGPAVAGSQRDWHGGGRPGGAHGYGFLVALMSVLASWFLVYDVILTGLRLPLPGRLGLLVAIYTLIRALLKLIFRRRR